MTKRSRSSQTTTSPAQVGGDGWFTLALSTTLIFFAAGATLLWMGYRVLRQARLTSSRCDSDIELVLIPCMQLSAGKPNLDFRLRLERAHQLHQQTGCQLLLMGGVTGSDTISEAAAGKQFLVEQGLAPSALILEDGSRNTLENLHNSREQLRNSKIQCYALTSNRYHLARCQTLANGLGLYPALCAAEDHFKAAPSGWPRLLLEAFYLHWYHTGKWWSRLSRSRHSLSRIS